MNNKQELIKLINFIVEISNIPENIWFKNDLASRLLPKSSSQLTDSRLVHCQKVPFKLLPHGLCTVRKFPSIYRLMACALSESSFQLTASWFVHCQKVPFN